MSIYGFRLGGGLLASSGTLTGSDFSQKIFVSGNDEGNYTDVGQAVSIGQRSTDGVVFVSGTFAGDGSRITNINVANLDAVGSNTQIQFNQEGEFSGAVDLQYYTASSNTLNDRALIVGGNNETDISGSGVLLIAGDATFGAELSASSKIQGGDELIIAGDADLNGALDVAGAATLQSSLQVEGISNLTGNVFMANNLTVDNAATLRSTLNVTGAATFDSILHVANAATFASTLKVTGAISGAAEGQFGTTVTAGTGIDATSGNIRALAGNVSASANAEFGGALTVAGNSDLNGNLDVAGKVDLAAEGVATTVRGTLNVDQAATFDSTLAVTGAATLKNTLSVSSSATFDSTLKVTGAISGAAEGQFGTTVTAGTGIVATSGDISASAGNVSGSGNALFGGALTAGTGIDATSGNIRALAGNVSGSGNAEFGGALTVAGATTLNSTLNVAGQTTVTGNILPGADSTYNLGTPTQRWANMYTGDLHLRNERGDWTLFEEADHIKVRNNLSGKMFRMALVADE